ncbi:S-layer homology domain-containing protein [Bacillus sp. FJAT-26390]|uniref:S-layer homology domain-containing protein n=1 Tax=Bacillus sp. FJAT-26390 TaxID=1743142 RepID=UPI000807C5CF|nr:S-layer homology domain-containing protein [Bacillus sp. FJAT-26390]OBZ17618.1 hypothetical protein A7975_07115 [Bacillus sp. FJAT-26390]
MKRKMIFILLMSIICSPSLLPFAAFAADSPAFQLTADKQKLKAGETVTIRMDGKHIKDMYAYEAKFTYDPKKLELLESKSQMKGFSVSPIKKDQEITIAHTKIGNIAGEEGDVFIGTLKFKAKTNEAAAIKWEAMKVVDSHLQSLTYTLDKKVLIAAAAAISFTDIKGHWAEDSIMEAASKGMIAGYPDGSFLPNGSITRTQFAVILSRALQLQEQSSLTFTDAKKIPEWAKPEVAKAVKAGLIQGYEDHSFRGDQTITRAEMAAIAARSLKIQESDGTQINFADNSSIPSWAKEWVEIVAQKGIMQGRGGNRFVPGEHATRAEATVIVLRLLETNQAL